MYKEFLEINKKKGNNPMGKWAKVKKKQDFKKKKKSSKLLEKITSVEIREIQIRTFNPSDEQN